MKNLLTLDKVVGQSVINFEAEIMEFFSTDAKNLPFAHCVIHIEYFINSSSNFHVKNSVRLFFHVF